MKLYSIKPLEWEEHFTGQYVARVPSVTYSIRKSKDKWEVYDTIKGRFLFLECESLDEAKAKAQEDWNNRISQYLTEYKEA